MLGKYCDAEIGRIGEWKLCRKRPAWTIQAQSGRHLEYCGRHKNHAANPACMVPATFAKLVLLRAS